MRGAIILPYIPLISLPPASFTICPNLSDFHGRSLRCRSPAKDTPRTGTKNIRVYCRLAVAHILTSIKKGMTIRAERAASLAKCLVKNGVNIIYR